LHTLGGAARGYPSSRYTFQGAAERLPALPGLEYWMHRISGLLWQSLHILPYFARCGQDSQPCDGDSAQHAAGHAYIALLSVPGAQAVLVEHKRRGHEAAADKGVTGDGQQDA